MKKRGKHTVCIHHGEIKDEQFGGAISPIFMASSYPFLDTAEPRYPRMFNTPNQEVIARKIAALENAETGLPFASGMAAISTTLLALLESGDHVIFQNEIYGGTYRFVHEELLRLGVLCSFTKGVHVHDFEELINDKTKIIYIETPSNPLLTITDIEAIAKLSEKYGLKTIIDNTFASPINQTPINLGVDISIHSATKYLGGHSDMLAGVVVGNSKDIQKIYKKGVNLGGNLSDFMCFLLERSIKTLGIRIEKHNENAMKLAEFLNVQPMINKVYYPGLRSHANHNIAKKQMSGFGGMLSFELDEKLDVRDFQRSLKLIKPSMSLAGVESTILMPTLTSHASLSESDKEKQGIKDNLLRLSVGIENVDDLIDDLTNALNKQ